MYVYASTDEILYKAIIDSPLFADVQKRQFEIIPIDDGTILKINPGGTIESEIFHYHTYIGRRWWDFEVYSDFGINDAREIDDEYLEALKLAAFYQGIEPGQIDELIAEGFGLDEIEQVIYEI